MIILILKKENPLSWSDYRPISLCNVTNKIITKILTARLSPLRPLIIAPNQSGFFHGRLLSDNVLLAQEMFFELNRCNPTPNVALKLDMAKAYDRVQWNFLFHILRHMKFPETFIKIIERCISRCWFSVLVNGEPTGFFNSSRGLRQGDPISPSLFAIAAEYLSWSLDKLILGHRDTLFRSSRYCMEISHLAYVDDILVFTQAAYASIKKLCECLEDYENASGQLINIEKSNFYISEAHEEWANSIHENGGFNRGSFPFMYLGVPIFRGPKRTELFHFIREKIAKRVQGWAHRHLSFGGRLTLIKSTLKAFPLHIFQALEPTAGAIQQLEQQLARFFWGSTSDNKRTHWISWEQIFLPTAEGGLGVQKIDEVVKAFSLKLWWRFKEQSSLWAIYMFKKYCHRVSPLSSSPPSRSSSTWKRLSKTWTLAHPFIRWTLGDGSALFWDDIWLGESSLRTQSIDTLGRDLTLVLDLWQEGSWSAPKLRLLQAQAGIPQQIVDEILDTPILSGEKDSPIWSLSTHGNFTLSSAWDLGRSRKPTIPLLEKIWNPGITASISIFMWRLISNRIPVDAKLQWRGISLASKCFCCDSNFSEESLHHLFIASQGANKAWNEFDSWFPGHQFKLHPLDSILERTEAWARRMAIQAADHVCRIIPCLIFWFTWAERNNRRHKNEKFLPLNISWQINMFLRRMTVNGILGPAQWGGCKIGLEFGIRPKSRSTPPRPTLFKWQPPDEPLIKLNVVGLYSRSDQRGYLGGILRDYSGTPIRAFSTSLPASSDLDASLLATLQGLQQGILLTSHIWIELNTNQVFSLIDKGGTGPAHARTTTARIRLLLRGITYKFSTIPKAGNKIALALSKIAMKDGNQLFLETQPLPNLLKGMVQLEKRGIPIINMEEEIPP